MTGFTLQFLKKCRLNLFHRSIFEPLKNDVKKYRFLFFSKIKSFVTKKKINKNAACLTNLRFLCTACHYDIRHPVFSAPLSITNNQRNPQ